VLYGRWLQEIGMVHNKFSLILNCLSRPGYLVLLILVVYFYWLVVWHRCKLAISIRTNFLLAALLPLAFFIIALIPPTMWLQYLAMPVPFLVISLAYPLFYLRQLSPKTSSHRNFKIACVLLAICVVVAVVSNPVVLYKMPIVFAPEYWVPVQIHNISEDIAHNTLEPKLILTLAPLFALEGGGDIYTELSAGAIVYRIADRLSPWHRDITHTAGPGMLEKLIEKSPPAAMILGVEINSLEEPIFKTAIQPNEQSWKRKVYENGPIVYFRR
jgi:hypothetical protein